MATLSEEREPERRITRNAARCLRCNSVVESRHRHDYVPCSCGAIAVDGGHAYLRRVTLNDPQLLEAYEELSEYTDER